MKCATVALIGWFCCLLASARAAESEADSPAARQVMALIEQGELDAAAERLDEAIGQTPDSPQLQAQRLILVTRLEQAGRPDDAARQLAAVLPYALRVAAERPQARFLLTKHLERFRALRRQAERSEELDGELDKLIQAARSLPGGADLQWVLESHKALLLAEAGKRNEAVALAERLVGDARAAREAAPDDADAVVRLINVRKTLVAVLTTLSLDRAAAAEAELLKLLADEAPKHKDHRDVVQAFLFEHLQEAGRASREDPQRAAQLVAACRKYIASLNRKDPEIRTVIARAERGLTAVEALIQSARQRGELVGSPAQLPVQAAAWINGGPVTPGQLEGKVVVLNFWAAWSGPCVALFPTLRRWHEQYSGQGLVLIGVTRYSHIDWDDQQRRITPAPHASPLQENDALERYVRHHKLPYPTAVLTDVSLMRHYGTHAVPQLVVIDRRGAVRLVVTGGSERQAREAEAAIKECLAEQAGKP